MLYSSCSTVAVSTGIFFFSLGCILHDAQDLSGSWVAQEPPSGGSCGGDSEGVHEGGGRDDGDGASDTVGDGVDDGHHADGVGNGGDDGDDVDAVGNGDGGDAVGDGD